MTALLVHGWPPKDEYYDANYPTTSNSHWFPWLSKQLMIKDIHTVALEMPNAYYPNYEGWKRELERYDLNEQTTLVGHSCGAGFLVRYLSENPDIKVGRIVFVAPWMGFDPRDEFDDSFFDFEVDSDLTKRTSKLSIIFSDNDDPRIKQSVELLRTKFSDAIYKELEGRGHFTLNDMGTEEFPELLEELLA